MAKLELLSRTIYDADGVQTNWDFNFASGYLLPEHVKAYYELGNVRTQVTVAPAMLIGPNQLRIVPAVPAGAVLTIYRDTPKNAPLVDFVDRGTVSEVALDTIAKQAVFVAAESSDSAATAATDVAVNAAASAQLAALSTSVNAASAAASALAATTSANTAASTATAAVTAHKAELAASNGATQVGYTPSTTVRDKLQERVSILDFGGDPTGVVLCNAALDAAKAVCPTVYFPPGTYRIEGYNLQDLRLLGAGTTGANYGVFTSIIEGSGDIFIDANNFSLDGLTIRNSASGVAGKLIQVADIDTSIGPIDNCNFLKATHHIYHSSATRTIVGASIRGCLFREATAYSRYYDNAGMFQYSEFDCYTAANKRGFLMKGTSTALIAASVFEFNDEGAIYVDNTAVFSDVVRSLKLQNIHFEHNGNVTPSADVTIHVTLSLARVEFDSCGFYASTLPGNVDLNGCTDVRVFEHNCVDISYSNAAGAKFVALLPKTPGEDAGISVVAQDIQVVGGKFIGNGGFVARGMLSTRIYGTETATVVVAPTGNVASLVVVRDATTNGAAILLLTPTTVEVVSSSLTSITFTIVAGYLNARTTGGSSFRDLYFNYMTT